MPIPVRREETEEEKPKPETPPPTPKHETSTADLEVQRFKEKFDDVVGMKRVKQQLADNIGLAISNKMKFDEYRKERSYGLILYGPPGCGKSFIIKALGGEFGINVIVADIAEILSSYTGDTEKHIKELFVKARDNAPCVIFFDEFDTLGMKRSLSQADSNKVMHNAVNQLLVQLDSVNSDRNDVFVIGATNQPWNIEPSLLRGGRFQAKIYVPAPSYRERMRIFAQYLKVGNPSVLGHIDYGRLARATSGFSSSDIKGICEQAKLKAIKQDIAGRNARISTASVLAVLLTKEYGKPSLDNWYTSTARESMKEMNQDARMQYRDLIEVIRANLRNRLLRTAFRLMAFVI